ncbi:MAG: alpha/beta fold hydrolase [Solirubrobacterales bacterium]|nr:alpha/beta fold hydrolase [Solirubrobacterales bacterium]
MSSFRRGSVALAAAMVVLVGLAITGSASAKLNVMTLKGYPAPGTPTQFNKVKVLKQGNPKAKKILLLEPGTSAGATNFRPLGGALVKRLKGWQVWSIERRENLLEDHSMLESYLKGQATNEQMLDYYLGWLIDSSVSPHFEGKTTAETQFAKNWGLKVAVGDIKRVVNVARRGGRKVVLGGHSLGGSIVTAYATWNFNGRPGAKDLAGLVFIDGAGAREAADLPTAEDAQASLDSLNQESASPFITLVPPFPWAAGVFNAMGSTAALLHPNERSLMDDFPLLPADLKPPVSATNLAQYAYAVDADTGPENLRLVQSHIGDLAPSGDPRGWVDGQLGTAKRAASVFMEIDGMDGTSWYHPMRLTIDAGAINNGIATPAQKVFGIKTTMGRRVRLPMYSFDAALGDGRIKWATAALAAQSKVPKKWVRSVVRSKTYAHIDPLSATPAKNDFIKTLVPFLRNHVR